MKKRQMLAVMMGAALACGGALAQADGPQGPGPRGDRPGPRPEGEGRGRMQQRGPSAEGFCPAMRQERGREGMECPQMRPDGPGPGMEIGRKAFQNPKRLKEAGATDQQLEALKKFAEEQQFKRIDLQAVAEKAELSLGQLMNSETVDEKAALKAVDALSQARAEIFKLEVSSKLKMREILGAEVQKKLREMGPPEGGERPVRGPRPEGPARKDVPPTGDRQ